MINPDDDRLGEWELQDLYFDSLEHSEWCACETCCPIEEDYCYEMD